MIKEYSQNRSNVIMNFSVKYCNSSEELLNSFGFKKVLEKYILTLEKKDTVLYDKITRIIQKENLSKTYTEMFKLLLSLKKRDVSKLNEQYKKILLHKDLMFEFIEGLYSYWRSLERYALIQSNGNDQGIQNVNFIEANNGFANVVLKTYRAIEENILGEEHNIYRQLSAGINAGIVLMPYENKFFNHYEVLENILFIKSIVLTPPYIVYPKNNKRSGLFKEVYENPITDLPMNKSHYFCYPAKVGESLAFIYFHRDFMNHGISLCNLFELAKPDEYKHSQPDLIYVFGQRVKNQNKENVFYHDKDKNIYIGFAPSSDDIDYFGYMKKMILTLHNVRMLDRGHLPIHGAMVNVTLKNGKNANIAIMGDSGAGKSESLEAFRTLSSKYLKEIKIIFDDMGVFKVENGKIYGYGTEVGAFVRLDDLADGYAYEAMDRGIFMNPHRINARLLYPVSNFKDIMHGYKVDIFLYANNYVDKKQILRLIEDKNEAITIFKKGTRKAKGTTTESGVIDSYFANPFGVVQRKQQSEEIIKRVFDVLYDTNVEVGEIYTKLAIDGYERKGPEKAAQKLFEWIMN